MHSLCTLGHQSQEPRLCMFPQPDLTLLHVYVPQKRKLCFAVQSELHSDQNIISEFTPDCLMDFEPFIGFQAFLHSPEI